MVTSNVIPLCLLRAKEVRRRLGVSNTTLYELIAKGHFSPPVKVGPRVSAWPEADVTAYIERLVASRDEVAA